MPSFAANSEQVLLGLTRGSGLRSDASPSESSQIRSFNTAETESNFIEDVHSVFNIVVAKLIYWWERSVAVLWRTAEVHWIKLLCILIVMSAIKEVTVANVIPLSVLIICFPAPSMHSFLVTSVFIFTGLQIIMKMIFQLDIVSDAVYHKHTNTGYTGNPSHPKYSVAALLPNGTGRWIGLDVVEDFPKYIEVRLKSFCPH
ncbi:unnamed protein product [Dibothriocephalus latus]|uniref:Uncharacterized protein n=1 Tax=Dibothriocephalus latus TaxID=60516 RepID=A0A3P7LVK4_DIBLA|nr:unnamed protein product [Dibothriocephalus latus]